MNYPQLVIDLQKIEHNARNLQSIAVSHGVQIVGVTKGVLGDVEIARAMLDGGVQILADNRLESMEGLRQAFPHIPLMLLRVPSLSWVERTVALTDISLNSELRVLQALSNEAVRQGKRHKVILMVETGDLREGVPPQDVPETVKRISGMKGLEFLGIGAHFGGMGGMVPSEDHFRILLNIALELEYQLNIKCQVISGGGSANLSSLLEGQLPSQVNQLRAGEGIILGRESVNGKLIPGSHQDAITLRAEVIGNWGTPANDHTRVETEGLNSAGRFPDENKKRWGTVALRRQDVPPEGIIPRDPRLKIGDTDSDHLIVDLTEAPEIAHGSVIEFNVLYPGLMGAMTSPAVQKVYVEKTNG